MAIDIEVFDTFRITTDGLQVVVHRKTVVDPTKSPNWEKRKAEGASPEIREEWVKPTFHGSIEKAVQYIANQRVLETYITTVDELLRKIRQIRREISDVLSVRGQ